MARLRNFGETGFGEEGFDAWAVLDGWLGVLSG